MKLPSYERIGRDDGIKFLHFTALSAGGVGLGVGAVGAALAAHAAAPGGGHHHLGIIPEHLAESINHLRKDEGVESGSNPATPIPTPISPNPSVHRFVLLLMLGQVLKDIRGY